LGPGGSSLRRLQEQTLCKMMVLGRNSMRDKAKEAELRGSKDPKFAHLNRDLHIEISTVAPPAEAYARMAYALTELRKYLIPDNNVYTNPEHANSVQDEVFVGTSHMNTSVFSSARIDSAAVALALNNSPPASSETAAPPAESKDATSENINYKYTLANIFEGKSKNKLVPPPNLKTYEILQKVRSNIAE